MKILNKKTLIGLVVGSFLINFTAQVYAEEISNIVTVAKSGGDYTDPISAMASIVDASVDNPYLISIAPGTYSLSATLNVKPFVSITGSGQSNTKLINQTTGTTLRLQQIIDSNVNDTTLTDPVIDQNLLIEGALGDASTISNLTIENSSGASNCSAIYVNNDGVGVVLKDLTVIASGCQINVSILFNVADKQGIYHAKMDTVTVRVRGEGRLNSGVSAWGTRLDMTGVDISVSEGTSSNTGLTVVNSAVEMLSSSIRVIGSGSQTRGILFDSGDLMQESRMVNSMVKVFRDGSSYEPSEVVVAALDLKNENQLTVERSTIKSELTALYADSTSSIKVRSSTILGENQGGAGGDNTGVKTCINTGNGEEVELSAACL